MVDKSIDHVDDGAAGFIARSPLFVFATASADGTDASPRGGPPGFVRVLDPHRIAFGDLSGNNRLDSYTNLVERPTVGLLFIVPGTDETLRVNGHASLTDEPDVLERCAIDGRLPKVAVEVTVTECFIHCAKAFRRGAVWDPSTWPTGDDRPSAAAIINDHLRLGLDPAVIEADLEIGYAATLWQPGGDDDATSDMAVEYRVPLGNTDPEPAPTRSPSTFVSRVAEITDRSPNLREVVLEGGLDGFRSSGGDQFVYLMVRRDGDAEVPADHTLAAQLDADPETGPIAAYYTVRSWDVERTE